MKRAKVGDELTLEILEDTAEMANKIDEVVDIMYEKIKGNTHLLSLFNGAHINTVFSYQNSGTKLKLINALYNSRFCLINDNMIDEESIKKVCDVENDLLKYKERIKTLIAKDYNLSEERVMVLRNFVNQNKLILQKIF